MRLKGTTVNTLMLKVEQDVRSANTPTCLHTPDRGRDRPANSGARSFRQTALITEELNKHHYHQSPHTHENTRSVHFQHMHQRYITAPNAFPCPSSSPSYSASPLSTYSLPDLSLEQYAGTDVKMYYFGWLAPMFCVYICVYVCARCVCVSSAFLFWKKE